MLSTPGPHRLVVAPPPGTPGSTVPVTVTPATGLVTLGSTLTYVPRLRAAVMEDAATGGQVLAGLKTRGPAFFALAAASTLLAVPIAIPDICAALGLVPLVQLAAGSVPAADPVAVPVPFPEAGMLAGATAYVQGVAIRFPTASFTNIVPVTSWVRARGPRQGQIVTSNPGEAESPWGAPGSRAIHWA